MYRNVLLFIAGRWREGADGKSLPVLNPATVQPLGTVACASEADIDDALRAAEQGFRQWSAMTAGERAKVMRRAALLLRDRANDIAMLITLEQGKPLSEALAETFGSAELLEWFADESLRIYGRVVPSRTSLAQRQTVYKLPVGPAAAFTPWNFPLSQVVRKVGAALCAGCSMLVKAAEETPAAAAELVRAFDDAGAPSGTLGLIFGDPAQISARLIESPVIRKVSFTGSTSVGRQLAALAGEHMKPVTMELGGHAPVIVAATADISLAVSSMTKAKFRNAGQVCISPSRFLVQRRHYADFVDGMAEGARQLVVGAGTATETTMGPLSNARRKNAVMRLTSDAVAAGAKLVEGGGPGAGPGHFWNPTVLSGVPSSAAVFNEEPFGPIAAIQPFDDIEDAIREANRLSVGLASYAFAQDLKTTDLLERHIEAGMLWINSVATPSAEMPFGGVKESGHGSEGGPEAVEAYLVTRAVSVMNA
jgi:succinate-semialdehyde dehydrogenase/glutarate-semialdehyde dehydrogenase